MSDPEQLSGGNGKALAPPVLAVDVTPQSRERMELAKLQAEAVEAHIRSVGEQVRFLAESPGVKAFMGDLGRSRILQSEMEKARAENEHIQKMQLDKLNAEAQRRREMLGAGVLLCGGTFISVFLLAGVFMVQKGWLSEEAVKWFGGLLTTLLVGLGIGRKSTSTP